MAQKKNEIKKGTRAKSGAKATKSAKSVEEKEVVLTETAEEAIEETDNTQEDAFVGETVDETSDIQEDSFAEEEIEEILEEGNKAEIAENIQESDIVKNVEEIKNTSVRYVHDAGVGLIQNKRGISMPKNDKIINPVTYGNYWNGQSYDY